MMVDSMADRTDIELVQAWRVGDDDAGSDAGSSVLSAVSDLEGDVANVEIETNERGRDRRSSAVKGRRDFGANGFEPIFGNLYGVP